MCGEQKDSYEVVGLVTFQPDNNKRFKAHPQELIEAQARALGLEHHYVLISTTDDKTYHERYRPLASFRAMLVTNNQF